MATATSTPKTTVEVVLSLDLDEARAMLALASRAEELDMTHPIQGPASRVFIALSDAMRDHSSYTERSEDYRSVLVSPGVNV